MQNPLSELLNWLFFFSPTLRSILYKLKFYFRASQHEVDIIYSKKKNFFAHKKINVLTFNYHTNINKIAK